MEMVQKFRGTESVARHSMHVVTDERSIRVPTSRGHG